jgi:hypothetical protein
MPSMDILSYPISPTSSRVASRMADCARELRRFGSGLRLAITFREYQKTNRCVLWRDERLVL